MTDSFTRQLYNCSKEEEFYSLSIDFTLLGDCPTEEGEALVYDMEIPIENFFPTIEILGRLSLSQIVYDWH